MALDYTTAAEAISETGTLHSSLIVGLPALPVMPIPATITIPSVGSVPIDMAGDVVQPNVATLTDGAVAGNGVFDKIMSSVASHIEGQYHKGVLGQSDVTAVYIAAMQAALPQAMQFTLSSEEAYWKARLIQIQTQNAYLDRARLVAEVETAKLTAYKTQAEAYRAQVEAITAQVVFANTKLQLTKTLQDINLSEAQQAVVEENFKTAFTQSHDLLPDGSVPGGHTGRDFNLKEQQLIVSQRQADLLAAQTNVQRAQTYDTNTDTTPVTGIMGVQKLLYSEQVTSYKRDAENKGVKMMADLWTSAKALDDATPSPGPLAGNLLMAMNEYINNLGLPNAMVNPDTPATGAPSTDTDWTTPGDQ